MTSAPDALPSVNGWNAEYIEGLYEQWRVDPTSVAEPWQNFFRGFELGSHRTAPESATDMPADVAHTEQGRVDSLIYHYRDIGHLKADLDPLGRPRPAPQDLSLASFNLTDAALDTPFDPGHLPLPGARPLREIIALLEDTYCRHFGAEYMHLQDRQRRRWLQQQMEPVRNAPEFGPDEKLDILRELCAASAFEDFLHTRFRGKKRFGLDGGESLIPMLDQLVGHAAIHGVEEYTFAMAHRGRLNVLVNVLRKTYDQLLTEFDEAWSEDFIEGGGDVKYHRGYSSTRTLSDGSPLRLTLSPNPSHLEFANSVVLGRARAKQRLREDSEREKCVPVLIHGDASFPGQGIVAECFNMMKLDGYTVGGAVHVVVNNQIGFTTDPRDAHSGQYCTDLAKMVNAPIFHVNGDDPEACAWAARVAIAFRQKFKNDVVIDLWCYRKFGHNEGDEPTFTQPLMYERIKNHTPVVELYAQRLIDEGVITRADFESGYESIRVQMDEAQARTREAPVFPHVEAFRSVWSGLGGAYDHTPVDTGVSRATLERVARTVGTVPDGFAAHKKIRRIMDKRRTAVAEDAPLDWAMGELLAYGTLLLEDHAVRLTGQDVERGTFSHRHAVIFDQTTGAGYDPLNHIEAGQARMCIHNSPLTESACLGFEYGYSLGDPDMLVIWEAQFGDFANGAQVIFDQFIASAEVKWRRYSGLVCFLPHGYEGQGPEHSSARLERFLTLCADDDMQVVYPTTPAQIFHLLRRQMRRDFRKPLIVMSPKSLLRHPAAVSPVADLVDGRFELILDDPDIQDPAAVTRVVLCTGKVYYDLKTQREKAEAEGTIALVRLEQLFPFHRPTMEAVLDRYRGAEFVWVQEEPRNMGAYRHVDALLREEFDLQVPYIGREANASPAVASMRMHTQEQDRILVSAIGLPDAPRPDAPAAADRAAS